MRQNCTEYLPRIRAVGRRNGPGQDNGLTLPWLQRMLHLMAVTGEPEASGARRRSAECVAAGDDWREWQWFSRSVGAGGRLEGSWTVFLGYLKERAVKVIRLFLSYKYLGLIEAARFRVLRFHEQSSTPATIEFLQHVYEHFSFAIQRMQTNARKKLDSTDDADTLRRLKNKNCESWLRMRKLSDSP